MEKNKLYNVVIDRLPISEIHPLHRAILNECCEHVEESDIDSSDEETMVSAVHLAFKIC